MGKISHTRSEPRSDIGSLEGRYVFDARGNGNGGVSPTITGDHQNRITDYTAIVLEIYENIGDTRSRRTGCDHTDRNSL